MATETPSLSWAVNPSVHTVTLAPISVDHCAVLCSVCAVFVVFIECCGLIVTLAGGRGRVGGGGGGGGASLNDCSKTGLCSIDRYGLQPALSS